MNSSEYQALLETELVPHLNEFQRLSFVFDQDNASVHVSQSAKLWLENHQIALLEYNQTFGSQHA